MKKRWTQSEIDLAISMLSEGKNFLEISNFINRSHESVTKKLRKLGYQSSYNKTEEWSIEEIEIAKSILDNGGSYLDVSKQLNKKHQAVDHYLRKRGLTSGYSVYRGRVKSKYEDYDWREIQRFYDEEGTYSTLVSEMNLTPRAIKWGKDNGKLKLRSVKEGVAFSLKRKPRSSSTDGIEKYRQLCRFSFNVYDYPEHFNLNLLEEYGWYKAKNRGDNPEGVSRDHMVSVSYGYENGILPYYISHPANCRLMQHNQNNKKNSECSITFEELLKRIDSWT